MTLRLSDEIDVNRGDLIASASRAPAPTQDLDGMVAWLAERPLRVGTKVLVQEPRPCRPSSATFTDAWTSTRWPPNPPTSFSSTTSDVKLRLAKPVYDDYTVSRRTGSFLIIDPQTAGTLAAGMVRRDGSFSDQARIVPDETLNWSI